MRRTLYPVYTYIYTHVSSGGICLNLAMMWCSPNKHGRKSLAT